MLTPAEIKKIASEVVVIMKGATPGPIVQQPATLEPVYTDPVLKSLDDAKAKVIDRIAANGLSKTVFKGRRGSIVNNDSQELLNMLDDQIQNRKNYRTQQRVS